MLLVLLAGMQPLHEEHIFVIIMQISMKHHIMMCAIMSVHNLLHKVE
jgi:hypothetical protein